MVYDVLRSEASDRDLDLIFDHLFGTYVDFGDTPAEALTRVSRTGRTAPLAARGSIF